MTLGIVLCGRVVEGCTEEVTAEPIETAHAFGVVRLQKANASQNRPAFAIFNDLTNPSVRISKWTIRLSQRRRKQDEKHLVKSRAKAAKTWNKSHDGNENKNNDAFSAAIQTLIGAILTLSGFVCQNIGTRELH